MQQYRKKQEIIDAEQFLGGTTLLGEEIIEHQCDYRMCDLCGGDNQKHLVVSNTNIIITQGNWLVRFREGNRLSYYSNEAFERFFEPVSAPSVLTPEELEKEATEAGKEYAMKHGHLIGGTVTATCVFADGYIAGHEATASCAPPVQPQSEGAAIDKLEILKRHYFKYYRPSYPSDERTKEVVDMALSIKEETACILAAMDEYKRQSEGGLQWVKAMDQYKKWLQTQLADMEAEKGCYPRSPRIQGRKRALENCSERFEQIFRSIQEPNLQTEKVSRWVNCAKRLPIDWEDDWNLMHLRYAQDHHKLDTDLFDHIDNALIKKNGFARLEYWQIEWLDESASPSTANTAVSALQSILRNIDNQHWNCKDFREEIRGIAEQGLKSANTEEAAEHLKVAAHEREVLAQAFDKVRRVFELREWVMIGRGSYPYDDDRYKEEVRYLYEEFDAIIKDTWANVKSKSRDYQNWIIDNYLKSHKSKEQQIAFLNFAMSEFSFSFGGNEWTDKAGRRPVTPDQIHEKFMEFLTETKQQ